MVKERQRREIKKRMRSIKDATDANAPEREINKRVKALTDYLMQEGIIDPFRDND